jgi:hypothetical protein
MLRGINSRGLIAWEEPPSRRAVAYRRHLNNPPLTTFMR